MKVFMFFSLFLLSVASVTGSNTEDSAPLLQTIKGIVLDEKGEALPGASVVIEGTTIGVTTNSSGSFNLQFRSREKRSLLIKFTGYVSCRIAIEQNENIENLKVKLEPSENLIDEVVITGSLVERPLKDVPVLTRVITSRNIQALNPANIETLLQYELPGLQIGYNSMSQMPVITYQGVGGEYLLFLLDGERISGEGADHNVDFSRFNIDDIERIEIVKGAQSTIYGSNALGGVINIITKNATRPLTGNLTARYGGNSGQKYTTSVGTKQNKFSTYTSLTYRTRDTYTVEAEKGKVTTSTSTDGSITESQTIPYSTTVYGYEIWDASQKFSYIFSDKLVVDIKGQFYHNKRDIRTGRKYQDFFVDYALNGKVKYLPSQGQMLSLSYVFDNYKKDKDYFEAGFTRTDYRNRTQIARVDYSGTFEQHTISAGIERNFEYLKHYMMKDSGNVSNESYALYLQEDWKITDKINIVAGIRADYHSKYHLNVTPKLSAMYRPSNMFTIRAGYSQGFRSPSLKELYQEYDMGGLGWMMLYGNPNLKPETSNQYAASAEFTKGGLNISLSGYHNRFKNKIAYALLGDGSSDRQYINAEKAQTTGVEAIAQWRMLSYLTVSTSYAYVNDAQEVDGRNTSYVRPHSITFNALFNKKFRKFTAQVSLNGQWSSELDTYNVLSDGSYELNQFKSRTLCSLNTGVQLPRGITVNIGVENLLNYKDKASDSSLQLPQMGITGVATLNLNLADMFKW